MKVQMLLARRYSGKDFDRLSFLFLEGWISEIRATCKYPNRNPIFKTSFIDGTSDSSKW